MKLDRAVVLVMLAAIASCSKSRRDKCEALRDIMLSVQESSLKEALGAVVSLDERAKLEAQGNKELAQFKANFADACAAQATLDLGCFEHQTDHPSPECKQPLETLWKAVYK